MLKKADKYLVLIIVVLALVVAALVYFPRQTHNGQVEIIDDGESFGVYPLAKDAEIVIEDQNHKNVVVIQKGQVRMLYADCPNQICVEHRPIAQANQSITCVPNKVLVRIENGTENEIDALVQ